MNPVNIYILLIRIENSTTKFKLYKVIIKWNFTNSETEYWITRNQ